MRSERATGAMARLSLWKSGCRLILVAVDDSPEQGEARLSAPRRILADAGAEHAAVGEARLIGARITPERVRGYVERLQDIGNSTATILARLQELGEVARVMNPDRPWSFIRQLASRVRAHHRPARSKHHLRPSDELVTLGFSLIERAAQASTLEAALLTRDGLLIALLALVPLRRRNLADLRIDETLIRQPSQ